MFQIHATYYLKKTKHKSTIKEDFIDNVVKKKVKFSVGVRLQGTF